MHSAQCRGFRSSAAVVAAVMLVQSASACSSTPVHRLPVVTAPQGAVVSRLGDLAVPAGTTCLVTLISGETVQGTVVLLTPTELVLQQSVAGPSSRRAISDADIARVARVAGRSKPFRGAIGAAIGAVVSLPLSISMVGDALLVGALMGNLLGRMTGDSRLEVLLLRR